MLRTVLFGALAMLLLAPSCTSPHDAAPSPSEVRRVLGTRDVKLSSYHVKIDTEQGEAKASHEFFFRAPNHSLGTIFSPEPVTMAFDGRRFFKEMPLEKMHETYELKLSRESAALFLTSTFTPFVPEGFRTPLMPSSGVTVKKTSHPRARDAVLVTAVAEGLTVMWVLRWPTGDVLAKRAGEVELSIDEEYCDQKLELCVPKKVTQRRGPGGTVEATTVLTLIELNPRLPNDFFTLTPSAGFHTEQHEIVETKRDEAVQQKVDASWQP